MLEQQGEGWGCNGDKWAGLYKCCNWLATAYTDSIPLVVISGQVPLSLIGNRWFSRD